MIMLDFTNDVLYNVEGTKHWTPDPDITLEQLDEMREEVFERIIVARVGLLLRHPFFGNMATRLRILAADDWCPTAAVDGRNLYFNTQFFNKMNNKEIEFVIAHEILHCVFDHLGRREGRDPKLYNIAADYIVNNLLVRDRIGEKPSFIDCFQDFKYDKWTSEEVYDDIYEQAKQNGKEFLEQLGEMLDEHLDGLGDSADGEGDAGEEQDSKGNKVSKKKPKFSKEEIFFCLPFFVGKNPINVKASDGNPDALTAVVKADAPGIGTISIPSLIHFLIKLYPGSLIVGVPASEINATSLLSFKISKTRAISLSLL